MKGEERTGSSNFCPLITLFTTSALPKGIRHGGDRLCKVDVEEIREQSGLN